MLSSFFRTFLSFLEPKQGKQPISEAPISSSSLRFPTRPPLLQRQPPPAHPLLLPAPAQLSPHRLASSRPAPAQTLAPTNHPRSLHPTPAPHPPPMPACSATTPPPPCLLPISLRSLRASWEKRPPTLKACLPASDCGIVLPNTALPWLRLAHIIAPTSPSFVP